MKKFIEEIREKYNCEPPVIYYLLSNSKKDNDNKKIIHVKSNRSNSEIKIQPLFYKPISNININE